MVPEHPMEVAAHENENVVFRSTSLSMASASFVILRISQFPVLSYAYKKKIEYKRTKYDKLPLKYLEKLTFCLLVFNIITE